MKFRVSAVAVTLALTGTTLSACSSSGPASTPSGPASATASPTGKVDLAAAGCPATVVVQTDWDPEAEHAHLYQMLGPNPTIDKRRKAVTGELYAHGQPTGVQLQIRAGGPAIGYQTDSAQLYQDRSITMAYISTDEAIEYSGSLPTTSVFAENDQNPTMLFWDPATYPEATSIQDLGAALTAKKGVVRYYGGSAFMEYLTGAGVLPRNVADGSLDGSSKKFVADQGRSAQQGFSTSEPYIYEHETRGWDKPVRFELVSDTGWAPYPEDMAVRTGDLPTLKGCLKALVPVMQQADADYFANPGPTNDLIVRVVKAYDDGWTYDRAVADFAAAQMKEALGIASDGPNGYVGDVDASRVQSLIDVATPIFAKIKGAQVKSGLKPTDLFTNDFLDRTIRLGF